MCRNLILHLFMRKLKDIIPMLEEIKACGFTAIQISPIQPCIDSGEWWSLYQVYAFSVGNSIGTEAELRELCTKANALGIKIICDLVISHVAGQKDNHIKPANAVSEVLTSNKFFWKESRNIENWEDRYQVINWCYDLPCLRLDNYDLENMVIEFMNKLINIGVRGFRIDSAKSISLPDEGNDFWWRVLDALDKKEELLNYAEVIFYPTYMLDRYSKYANILSNTLCSDKSKSVTFFMTHDSDNKFEYTSSYDNNTIISKWKDLISSNRESHMLFYARPTSAKVSLEDSFLWRSGSIRNINSIYA